MQGDLQDGSASHNPAWQRSLRKVPFVQELMSDKRKKDDFEDDGRTIADMSGVERPSLFGHIDFKPTKSVEQSERNREPLDKKQTRSYIFATVLSGLAIGGVFIIAGALLITFLLTIWAH